MDKKLKISMFITAFIPLWINILLIDILSILKNKNVNTIIEWISIIIVLLVNIYSIILIIYTNKYFTQNSNYDLCQIKSTTQERNISSSFLLSYILPLFIFDFTNFIGTIQFLIYFIILAYLCIRNDYVYVNILLEILGYKIFNCEVLLNDDNNLKQNILYDHYNTRHITIISNDNLLCKKSHFMNIQKLNNNIYFHNKKYDYS